KYKWRIKMKVKTTYIGTLDGVSIITNGEKPEGMIVTDEKLVLYADKDKILHNLETEEMAYSKVIEQLSDQEDWEELDDPTAKME
ncbi:MAG: hypothetical protein J6T10_12255, partial [Methanobrevibacter sp.]|nr:hypothetical protein [Methanobrevibacter sp.]